MPDSPLTISKVAKLASVGVETIRYYQRIGLINEPLKPTAGYRTYPLETISQLKFILRAKQLGFTLSEIKELLQLDNEDCDTTQQLAEQKIRLIKEKIADMQSITNVLDELVNSCKVNKSHTGCPIIHALSKD